MYYKGMQQKNDCAYCDHGLLALVIYRNSKNNQATTYIKYFCVFNTLGNGCHELTLNCTISYENFVIHLAADFRKS